MRTGQIAALLAAFALAAAGCGDDGSVVTAPETPAADDLSGRTFRAVEVEQAGRPHELVAGTEVTVRFTGDGRLIAAAGCNSMQAPLTVEAERLRMPDLTSGEMGCDEARHRQDRWLAGFLAAGPSWRLERDRLVLSHEETRLVLRDERVLEQDLPLRGTTWKVRSFTDGETASALADVGKAWLRFEEGGKVVGSTGCNQFGGQAEIGERRITFEPVVSTKRACLDRAVTDLEQKVLAVIDDTTVTYRIDGDELTLEAGQEKSERRRSLGLVGSEK